MASDLIHRRIEPLIRRATQPGEIALVTDTTSGVTLLSVQGPRRASCIARLTAADLSNAAFPYLTAQHIDVGYAPVLAIRVTYVGELGWELHIPAEYALGVWDDLMAAGAGLGVRPVGLDALSGLRLEKGYRDIGVDIDNTDTPLSAGLGFAVAWDKPGGFIGRDALLAERAAGPPGHRVVSLAVDDPAVDLFGNEPVLLDGAVGGLRPRRRLRLHHRRPGRPGPGLAPGRGHTRVAQDRRLHRPHPGRRRARPPADRAAVRPHPAAHPGPVGPRLATAGAALFAGIRQRGCGSRG